MASQLVHVAGESASLHTLHRGATGYNTYTYVTNNPTTWTDTSGEFELVTEGLNLKKSHLDSMP